MTEEMYKKYKQILYSKLIDKRKIKELEKLEKLFKGVTFEKKLHNLGFYLQNIGDINVR